MLPSCHILSVISGVASAMSLQIGIRLRHEQEMSMCAASGATAMASFPTSIFGPGTCSSVSTNFNIFQHGSTCFNDAYHPARVKDQERINKASKKFPDRIKKMH